MSSWGNYLKISIFGESHGGGIGVVMDGLPAGEFIDREALLLQMGRRAPGKDKAATPRSEADTPEILSGLLNDTTTGAPLCAVIRNTNTRSQDYGNVLSCPRPSHADYTGFVRYHGFNDIRGGGHFSGRLTAPLVFAGAVARQILVRRGIRIAAHISSVGAVTDSRFDPVQIP
ncbi:MAG TPA: chorismate synthase, partial [Ruminococcaceae bacterium]|nr:chorismate synthase [Oscillospiraceae bacterium]